MAMANIEEQIEVAPFIPQNAGIRPSRGPATIFNPMGNGIPIKNPSGNKIPAATVIRSGVVEEANTAIAWRVSRPHKSTTTKSKSRRAAEPRLGFDEPNVV